MFRETLGDLPLGSCHSSPHLVSLRCLLLNSKGPHESCNLGSSGQRRLIPGLLPKPVSKTPLFSDLPGSSLLLFLTEPSSPTWALSCCFFHLKPFLCFPVCSFNKHTRKTTWSRVARSFLHEEPTYHLLARGGPAPPVCNSTMKK